jgi:L-asparaginase
VPSPIVESLARINKEIPVVLVTRTGGGEIYESTYAFPGSEQDLLARGLISGNSFDAVKARLLLILLLASGADRPSIKDHFATALHPR